MTPADFPQELRSFAKTFQQVARRQSYSQVFDDFLTIVMCCYARESQEPLYFETLKRYSKEEIKLLPRLLGDLIVAYQKHDGQWADPLGQFYEVLASTYKQQSLGQYFSPASVCDIMAAFNGPAEGARNTGLLISDPACGSGRMLLAFNARYPGNVYVAEDLDSMCAKMTAVNLMFHGCRGEVINHNSLRPDSWYTGWMINADLPVTGCPSILELKQENSILTKMWKQELEPHKEATVIKLEPRKEEPEKQQDLKYLF